jgi:NADPH:quinone reductase-like Zn-dependent oxidoreductase
MALGTYQTYTCCKASDALMILNGMGFMEAAALPMVFSTAV